MCGVAGAFAADGERPMGRRTLLGMLAAQRHRGPDGCGIYLGTTSSIGSVRLAITGVTGGYQPFVSSSGKVVCCYNGEIYNHLQLRGYLSGKGCTFNSTCDGEVIANLYAVDGLEGLKRIEGQFALALWDSANRTGVLARDEFGILPLFLAVLPRRILFASTLAAFFAEPSFRTGLNHQALVETCRFWSPIGRSSILESVEAILPGEMLTIEQGVITSRWRRFQVPSHCEFDDESPPDQEEIGSLLREAVSRRLPQEVPYGVYISGGVDSAFIASAATQAQAAPIALSVTFPDSRRDESEEQRAIVQALGLRHHSLACTAADVAANFAAVVRQAEAPLVRTAPVGTYLLSRLARDDGIKVVLSGEGADELFAGYDIYRSIPILEQIACGKSLADVLTTAECDDWLSRDPFAIPLGWEDSAAGSAQIIAAQAAAAVQSDFGVHIMRWTNTSRLLQLLHPDLRPTSSLIDGLETMRTLMPPDYSSLDSLSRSALLDFNSLLAGYLLSSQGDRMAMAHSVEMRVPFLDRALVRRVWRLPWRERMPRPVAKLSLRKALHDVLPDTIRMRPKKAYAATDFALNHPGVWQSLERYLSPDAVQHFGLFDSIAIDALIHTERQMGGLTNDFISPFALVASTHILAEHFEERRAEPEAIKLEPSRLFRDLGDHIG